MSKERTLQIRPRWEVRVQTIGDCCIKFTPRRVAKQRGSSSKRKPPGAEMFGAELVADVEINLPPATRASIVAWEGGAVTVKGRVDEMVEAQGDWMAPVLNLHAGLTNVRHAAEGGGVSGPRVLVCGEEGAGKSSVVQVLANYAVREGWRPTFVNLDSRGCCDKASLALPAGTIGALPLAWLSVEQQVDPLTLFFGHLEREDDPVLHSHLTRCLAASVEARLVNPVRNTGKTEGLDGEGKPASASGLLIDTPPLAGAEFLDEVVALFSVDYVVIVGSPTWEADLRARISASGALPSPVVLKLAKNEGAAAIDNSRAHRFRAWYLDHYFGGGAWPRKHIISPQTMRLRSTEIHLLSFESEAPDATVTDGLQKIPSFVPFGGNWRQLQGAVLGVSSAPNRASAHCYGILCLVYVKHAEGTVEPDGRHVTTIDVVVPVSLGAGSLTNRLFLVGDRNIRLSSETN